jgi:uncharacterized protein with gpF-like domain
VRPEHAWRHGKYFKWGDTDIDPGEDFNCRCTAEPSFGVGEQISNAQFRRDVAQMNRDRRRQARSAGGIFVPLNVEELEQMAQRAA